MAVTIKGMSEYLHRIYEPYVNQVQDEINALGRILMAGPPRRRYHSEPPTRQKIREYEAWKKRYEKELERGLEEGWLAWEYDDGYVVQEVPHTVVWDETEEEHKEKVRAWHEENPGVVTIPVSIRPAVTAYDPMEEDDAEV